MFIDDEELKGYYGKHCGDGGEFSCLVCGVVNEKHLKRLKKFKECVALVEHSISIAKRKKIRSHRAYGRGNDVNGGCNSAFNKIMDDGLLNPDEKAHVSET
ncbi:unnamed protein product [Lactuca virosa]|uniref:Uncharacterized protein n=1 Tax=Lactuca virosa TaxID=75947 RepID=A0AAU9MDT6_9ASTR|nr:unnamed protein product [Lactuca virosa]CAH1431672.1 unnamed protein product [Lactuca virosa]